MSIMKAIKMIAQYCLKHNCDSKCRLYKDGECIRYTVPCDWEDFMKAGNNDE